MAIAFFDLEGPLSPQDNAYEVMGLFENGHKVFEVISKYDDILTLEGRENYEPGDTLKLIVPFLLYHGITEEDIKKVSQKAKIIAGTREAISELKRQGFKVFVISTSYQQHAFNIAEQIGIEKRNVACTRLELSKIYEKLKEEDLSIVKKAEEKILENYPNVDVEFLDSFFFKELQKTKVGEVFREVTIIGGSRKVRAMLSFIEKENISMSNIVAIGDSITDFKMLNKVREEKGLAIAFNGNEYCIPYASIGIATVDQRFILPVLKAFKEGGKEKAIELVKELEDDEEKIKSMAIKTEILPKYHCIEGASKEKIDGIIKVHKKYRMLVRGEAGKLG